MNDTELKKLQDSLENMRTLFNEKLYELKETMNKIVNLEVLLEKYCGQ